MRGTLLPTHVTRPPGRGFIERTPMSGASIPSPHHLRFVVRLIVLVAGVFAVLMLLPGHAKADVGDTAGVLTGAVEDVGGAVGETVGTTAATTAPIVDETLLSGAETAGDVVDVATDTVADASQTVTQLVQAADEVVLLTETVDGSVGTVVGTVVELPGGTPPVPGAGPTGGTPNLPAEPTIDPAPPAGPGGHPTDRPNHSGTSRPARATAPKPLPGDGASIGAVHGSRVVGPSSPHNVPTLPDLPVGASSAPSSGSPETGGHGLSLFAAFLAAAMALAVGMRRWLRPFADARAPNPFLSLLECPG